MNREHLISTIHELGLAAFKDEILRVSRPCLSITTSLAASPIPATESKIGGAPDLPPGVAWPIAEDDGTPMLFLARIVGRDLARIHPHLAEQDLLFFGDWEYNPVGKIISIPIGTHVVSTPSPERPDDRLPPLRECVAHTSEAVALPDDREELDRWRYSNELRRFGAKQREVWSGYSVTETPLDALIELQ